MKILTVDDDDMALEMLNQSLVQSGYQVESASNGQDALKMLKTGSFRIVITDWEMPLMNGLELCQAIREQQTTGYTYVILLTAHNDFREVDYGRTVGADDFVTKPFDPTELIMRVKVGERIVGLETRDVAIFAMAKLAESRDPETGAHLERIRQYCLAISKWLSIKGKPDYRRDKNFHKLIYLTSPLHDIGKIGIPDSILLKPGRFNDNAFEIMKTHTTLGARTLGLALKEFPEASFLSMAHEIALTHHERFDGTGYPFGLVGKDIPLSGRILALADVYDALISERVYKNALEHDLAKSIIIEESGSHFDPEIVEAFLDVEHEFIEIEASFADGKKSPTENAVV